MIVDHRRMERGGHGMAGEAIPVVDLQAGRDQTNPRHGPKTIT